MFLRRPWEAAAPTSGLEAAMLINTSDKSNLINVLDVNMESHLHLIVVWLEQPALEKAGASATLACFLLVHGPTRPPALPSPHTGFGAWTAWQGVRGDPVVWLWVLRSSRVLATFNRRRLPQALAGLRKICAVLIGRGRRAECRVVDRALSIRRHELMSSAATRDNTDSNAASPTASILKARIWVVGPPKGTRRRVGKRTAAYLSDLLYAPGL